MIEDVINEVDTDNNLWDATRQLVGTTTAGGSVASIAVSSISVDLDDYEIFYEALIDKADTGASARGFTLTANTNGFNNQYVGAIDTTVTGGRSTRTTTDETQAVKWLIRGYITLDVANLAANFTEAHLHVATSTSSFYDTHGTQTAALTNNIVTEVAITASGDTPINIGSKLTVYKIRR